MNGSAKRRSFELLWKLARSHGWTKEYISSEDLGRDTLPKHLQGDVDELLEVLQQEPYITYHPSKGYQMKNDPDSQAQAAYRVHEQCGYSKLRAEATFSRFEDAGGFDAYDEDEIEESLPDL